MSAPFEILPRAFIRKWLLSLVDRHGSHKKRAGCTIDALARYLDISRKTLKAFAMRANARMGRDRQRLLSKTIAMIENGQLEFEVRGREKIGVIRDNPKPICRYRVEFASGRPVVRFVARPKFVQPMPSFKSLTLTPNK